MRQIWRGRDQIWRRDFEGEKEETEREERKKRSRSGPRERERRRSCGRRRNRRNETAPVDGGLSKERKRRVSVLSGLNRSEIGSDQRKKKEKKGKKYNK